MFKCENIALEYDPDLLDLLPYLRESLIHITTAEGYDGIIHDQKILPSREGAFGPFALKKHCGKYLGNVCLIDTIGLKDGDICYGLEGMTIMGVNYFLYIDTALRTDLTVHNYTTCEGAGAYCQKVEKGYHGEIPANLINKVIRIDRNYRDS